MLQCCWLQNSWKQCLYRHHSKVNDNSLTTMSDVFPEVASQVKPPAVPSWLCNKNSYRRLFTETISKHVTTEFEARNWLVFVIMIIYLTSNPIWTSMTGGHFVEQASSSMLRLLLVCISYSLMWPQSLITKVSSKESTGIKALNERVNKKEHYLVCFASMPYLTR